MTLRDGPPEVLAEYQRRARLLHRYGLTGEDYERMLTEQGGHCALCDATTSTKKSTYLDVDHCHTTNVVRGLLCRRHNGGIGAIGDTAKDVAAALEYLDPQGEVRADDIAADWICDLAD